MFCDSLESHAIRCGSVPECGYMIDNIAEFELSYRGLSPRQTPRTPNRDYSLMFRDCSNINASGSLLSNVGRDQHNVGGDQYTATHQTFVNINIPTTASSNELHGQQDLAKLRLPNTVRRHYLSRALYLTLLCRLLTKLQRKQIGE